MSSSDPFDSLFGGGEPAAPALPPPVSPRAARRAARAQAAGVPAPSLTAAAAGQALKDVGGVQALRRPVTISLLATVFSMDKQTITRRLIDCPHVEQSGRKLYDFKEAVAHIIKPKMSPEQFIRTLNAAHLPPEINKAFWDGQRSRVRYKREAQEAWDTEDVLEALGDAFMTIKDVLTTFVEDFRESGDFSDAQAQAIEARVDALRDELHAKLVAKPAERRTPSIFEKPLFGIGGAGPRDLPDPEDLDEDDDGEDADA